MCEVMRWRKEKSDRERLALHCVVCEGHKQHESKSCNRPLYAPLRCSTSLLDPTPARVPSTLITSLSLSLSLSLSYLFPSLCLQVGLRLRRRGPLPAAGEPTDHYKRRRHLHAARAVAPVPVPRPELERAVVVRAPQHAFL